MKGFTKVLLNLLTVIFAVVFLVCAFLLGRYFLESHKQGQKYADLASQVAQVQQDDVPAVTIQIPHRKPAKEENQEDTATDPDATEPEQEESATILPEYTPIYLQNADLIGWIQIEDTKINYPVMQTPDRENFYLHRNFYGEYSSQGALYVDEDCDPFLPSDNLIIYGHHMKDGSMFSGLDAYEKKEFWETHRQFRFDTLTEHHTYEIFAVFITSAISGQGLPYHNFIDAANEQEFDDFVAACKDLSFYDTGITPEYGDKLVCLSTCEYTLLNGRLVVVGRRIS